jgi:CheY-like chemotaxis protein
MAAKIETLALERDAARARVQERDHELEELRTEIATAWSGAASSEAEKLHPAGVESRDRAAAGYDDVNLPPDELQRQYSQLSRQREAMRLQVIELNAKLENAQQEIKQLGAAVAAGRLQSKISRPIIGGNLDALPLAGGKLDEGREASRSLLAELRTGYENCLSVPDDFSNRRYLQRALHLFAEQTLLTDQWLAHCFGAALARLLEANNDPEGPLLPVPPMTGHTLDLLERLMKTDGLDASAIAGRRVLLVDDDPQVCETVVAILNEAAFAAESIQHSSGAIAQLACKTWDLILLDVRMPEIDGFELCSIIRGMAQHAGTPIIFLTGAPDEVPRSASGVEVLGKPCLPEDLTLRAMTLIVRSQLDARK